MFKYVLPLLFLAFSVQAATVRLYLKDGNYHLVSDYEKVNDRVRYFSTERGDWEEIPLELVDLKRTETEVQQKEASRKEEAVALDAEEKAERAQRRAIERIPVNAGVYIVNGDNVTALKQVEELNVVSNRRRSILKAITPIPIVAGKSTVEIDGVKAATVLQANRPELYVRLDLEERFGIVRLTPGKKNSRIVQTWNIVPVTKEIVEETALVETFRQQLADGLYKIWPTKPLEPGEYAVVEYTEGKGNVQAWDFSIQ